MLQLMKEEIAVNQENQNDSIIVYTTSKIFENKSDECNIKILEEIFELNEAKEDLMLDKLKIKYNLFCFDVITVSTTIITGAIFLTVLLAKISEKGLIPLVTFGVISGLCLMLNLAIVKNFRQKIKQINEKNESIIIKIKEKVNFLRKNSFFDIFNEKLNSKQLKIEKRIEKLKEELIICDLWKPENENFKKENDSNWTIICFNFEKLIKHLKKQSANTMSPEIKVKKINYDL